MDIYTFCVIYYIDKSVIFIFGNIANISFFSVYRYYIRLVLFIISFFSEFFKDFVIDRKAELIVTHSVVCIFILRYSHILLIFFLCKHFKEFPCALLLFLRGHSTYCHNATCQFNLCTITII